MGIMRPIDWRSVRRFLRYLLVGGSTFLFDLALIWAMTEHLGVPYYLSTAIGFFIASSVNYAVSRKYVFKGTRRRVHHGYGYFIAVGTIGSLAVTGLVTALVAVSGMHYLLARVFVAAGVGTGNYLFNLHWNFKVAGHHP
jgi:putative flippase GtrA